jgi:hypothetical protein
METTCQYNIWHRLPDIKLLFQLNFRRIRINPLSLTKDTVAWMIQVLRGKTLRRVFLDNFDPADRGWRPLRSVCYIWATYTASYSWTLEYSTPLGEPRVWSFRKGRNERYETWQTPNFPFLGSVLFMKRNVTTGTTKLP